MAKTLFFRSSFFCALILTLHGLVSCTSKRPGDESHQETSSDSTQKNHYSVGFDLWDENGFQRLDLYTHYNGFIDTLRYLLGPQGKISAEKPPKIQRINVPARRIALLHTSYYSYFEVCNATSNIAAISEAKYLYNQEIYNRVVQGEIPEVSFGESLNKEKLLELDIDLVINVGFPDAPNKELDFLQSLGIPVLTFAEWQEPTPLGRAEWVRVVGALTDTQSQADKYFADVASEYERLKATAADAEERPEAICNLPYKGIWYMPGGNSYMSHLIRDAGAAYPWSDNMDTGALQLSFEVVYAKGLEAPFWLNPGFAGSIPEILGNDERLAGFLAVAEGKVFNSTNRLMRGEANDYWESGLVNPHIILADLVEIFHPGLQKDHTLYYFKSIR